MTDSNSTQRSLNRQVLPMIRPLKIQLTTEEILADLLYPDGRETVRATIGRLS